MSGLTRREQIRKVHNLMTINQHIAAPIIGAVARKALWLVAIPCCGCCLS